MMSVIADPSSTSESGAPILQVEIWAVVDLCREALETDYRDLVARIPGLPQNPDRWIAILSGIPDDRRCRHLLGGLCEGAARMGLCPPGSVERFGMLQAALWALPRLESLEVHDSVLWQFCATFRRIATRARGWGRYLQHDSDAYAELARIVTLRRFHAGQISFDVMAMPRTWLLKAHPLALPSLIRELVLELGGLGPIMMPHLNYWRGNAMTLLAKENEASHYRMAQFMEQQPRIKGLVSASWLYSSEIKAFSPHISWLRDFYVENGAYLLDMEIAHERAGFLVGSEERRRLHAEGKLRPRETLVIWPRARMQAWARDYSRAPDTKQTALSRVDPTKRAEPKWQSSANQIFSSGQYTLLQLGLFLREKPRHYLSVVFGIPLLILAIAIFMMVGIWSVLPAIVLGFVAIWLFQYFFLQ
jgi:hypothetical protein